MLAKNWIIIKLGGSVLYQDGKLNTKLITDYKPIISELKKSYNIAIIVGGGKLSRDMVNALADQLSNVELDEISIMSTHIHARIVSFLLKMDYIKDYRDLYKIRLKSSLIVTGGFYPGQSTNGAAATVSEILDAKILFNLFNYDFVSANNPEEGFEPERIKSMNYLRLKTLNSSFKQQPGHYELFDHQASNICERSNIKIVFLNGKFPKQLTKYIINEDIGTTVMRGQ